MSSLWKKNEGLTLVELIVSIAIGTLIFAAATTVLLLGIRINHHTTDSVMQQYTARMVISMLEQMAEEGSFDKVQRYEDGSWKLGNEGGHPTEFEKVLLSYSASQKTVFTGEYGTADAAPLLENIIASYVILDESVLSISLEDSTNTYTSSVYCRAQTVGGAENFQSGKYDPIIIDKNITENKKRFLDILESQIGMRGGIINHGKEPENIKEENGEQTVEIVCDCASYNFFSEWYVGGYSSDATAKGWNADTPWCVCFISWGLAQAGGVEVPVIAETNPPKEKTNWFGNVDEFMRYFKHAHAKITPESMANAKWIAQPTDNSIPEGGPVTGNIVFFNFISEERDNPSHVGVVLGVKGSGTNQILCTIEGNSADRVVYKEYRITDQDIIGYGVLPWIYVPEEQ